MLPRRVLPRACWMWLCWWPTPLSWRLCCMRGPSTAFTSLLLLSSLCPSCCRSPLDFSSFSLVSLQFCHLHLNSDTPPFFFFLVFFLHWMQFNLSSSVKYNLNDMRKQPKLNMMNNATTIFVFFIVLINVFITALGFDSGRWGTDVDSLYKILGFLCCRNLFRKDSPVSINWVNRWLTRGI